MLPARRKEISQWASKVYEQAQMYADLADPRRTGKNKIAHQLDGIAAKAKMLHFDLTGKFPEVSGEAAGRVLPRKEEK